MSRANGGQPQPLHPEKLTWAALLGRWVDFSRSALGLPPDGAGEKARASVPDLIMLQAVWFGLGQLEGLDPSERTVGLDRAGVLVEKHAAALRARWKGEAIPTQIEELIADASNRLAHARSPAAALPRQDRLHL